jgi:hypothetical protein
MVPRPGATSAGGPQKREILLAGRLSSLFDKIFNVLCLKRLIEILIKGLFRHDFEQIK